MCPRPNRPAIRRNDSPAATPREISSRSVNDKHRDARRRGAGRTPPVSSISVRTDELSRPSQRAIFRIASPPCHRSHTSALSNSVNFRTTTSSTRVPYSRRQVLHPPPETTAVMCGSSGPPTKRPPGLFFLSTAVLLPGQRRPNLGLVVLDTLAADVDSHPMQRSRKRERGLV